MNFTIHFSTCQTMCSSRDFFSKARFSSKRLFEALFMLELDAMLSPNTSPSVGVPVAGSLNEESSLKSVEFTIDSHVSMAQNAIPSFSSSPAPATSALPSSEAFSSSVGSNSSNTLRKRKQRRQRDLETCCSKFIDHRWTLADSVIQQFYPEPTTFNKSVPQRHSLLELFFCFLPQRIWDILVEAANRNLVKGQSSCPPHCRESSHRDHYRRTCTFLFLLPNPFRKYMGKLEQEFTFTFQGVEEEICQVSATVWVLIAFTLPFGHHSIQPPLENCDKLLTFFTLTLSPPSKLTLNLIKTTQIICANLMKFCISISFLLLLLTTYCCC